MTDTKTLEQRAEELDRQRRALTQAESQQENARTRLSEIDAELTELGFDPSEDLNGQVGTASEELASLEQQSAELLEDVEKALSDDDD